MIGLDLPLGTVASESACAGTETLAVGHPGTEPSDGSVSSFRRSGTKRATANTGLVACSGSLPQNEY